MSVTVKVVKAVGLKKDPKKELNAYVTVKFGGVEDSTTVKQGTVNPVWNEVLELGTGAEEGMMTVEVYDRNVIRRTLVGKAQVNLKEKTGGVVLKLRGERRTSKPVSLGTISVEWTINTDMTLFKQNLQALTQNSYYLTLPMMWLTDLLTWHRPYETAFFLSLWTYTCLHSQFDLIPPLIIISVLLNSYYEHCRWGPEPPEEASVKSRYPDPFKFLGDGKAESQRVYETQQWVSKLAGRLDSIWDVLTFKNARAANMVVNFLLSWIVLELLGLCPGLNIIVMCLVWAVFLLYPLHANFPQISANYNLLTFLSGPVVLDMGASRIHYQPHDTPQVTSTSPLPPQSTNAALASGAVDTWLESTPNPPTPLPRRTVKPDETTDSLQRSSLSPNRLTEWNVAETAITKTEQRADTTYYKVETKLIDGSLREVWHRYSHFRSLKAAADKYDTSPHPPPFPGKTFGKCDGKDLVKRHKALEAFLIEITNRSHANMRLRGVVSRFLGTR